MQANLFSLVKHFAPPPLFVIYRSQAQQKLVAFSWSNVLQPSKNLRWSLVVMRHLLSLKMLTLMLLLLELWRLNSETLGKLVFAQIVFMFTKRYMIYL